MSAEDAPAIEFSEFRLSFVCGGSELILLDRANLRVESGGLYLLVGESGAGKSTLLKLITGLWEHREQAPRMSGELRVLGLPIQMSYPRRLRGRVLAVLQEEGLLDELSPRGNVELGLSTAGRSKRLALGLLSQAGLDQPPPQVAALSGGMRKRVAVARALAGEPALLIFDEPSTGLDADSARGIAELIYDTHRRAEGRRTTIVITHDLRNFEGLTDGILVLKRDERTVVLERPGESSMVEVASAAGTSDAVEQIIDEDPALRGLRLLLLSCADQAQTLWQALRHLPPVYPGLVLRTTTRYVLESIMFVAVGSATVGGLATYFALRNNPLGEGAFTNAVLTGSGKVLVSVLIPLIAGFFFTARIAAGAAARLGTMKRTSQVAALRLMGINPADFLLTPLTWAVSLSMPIVTSAGVIMACAAAYLACSIVVGVSPYGWSKAFFAAVDTRDIEFALLKTVLSGFLIAAQTYHMAMGPKRSGQDVGQAVDNSIVVGIFIVLVVHSLMTLVQFG